MLKRFDYRILLGFLLILGGGLLLAERLGYLNRASDLFWGVTFLLGGAAFVSMFIGGQWWAIIPGLTLAGIAGSILLPDSWSGPAVLVGIGLSFWLIYLTKRDFWWAIIPGGVLLTLAVITWLPKSTGDSEAFVLFLGLGITFLLVALLAGMRWAFWPAAALGVMAVLFGTSLLVAFEKIGDYIWPAILVLAGIYLVLAYFRKR